MFAVANSGAPPVNPWPSAAPSSASPQAELSGACALLAILVQTQSTSQAGTKTDIELDAKKLDELKKQLADAIQHAQEAAEDSGFFGFLGDIFGSDIAQIAGAVAVIAATVASGGATAPLLLIAVSEALQVGAKVGAELGLDPKLCIALSVASVAVGMGSGAGTIQATDALADGARKVELGARIVQGGATIAGGALHYTAAHYQAKQLNFQADAAGYHATSSVTQLSLDDAFATLERALRTEQREAGTVSKIVQNNSDTNTTLCDRI